MFSDFLIGIFASVLLGAMVGAQREMKQQKGHYEDFAGFRTFTFISLFGFLLGFLAFDILKSGFLILIGILGIFVLVSISYYVLSLKYKKYVTITSQISALIVFMIGVMISLKYYYESILLAVLVSGILVLGDNLHKFARRLTNNEVYATLKFAIISLAILPILPNKNYGPLDVPGLNDILIKQTLVSQEILQEFVIFNLYHIWLMVVFISGITYFGYIFMKVFGGRKGILLTGVLGGLMSSTALTSSFSIDSKKSKNISTPFAVGIILASSIMFFRIILEVFIVNPNLFLSVLFLSVMGFVGIIVALLFYNFDKTTATPKHETKSPFAFIPALKFGIFFFFVIFIAELVNILFGEGGIYLVAFFSGFADVDVITITLSRLALEGSISEMAASLGIFIAAIANTIFKGAIAYYLASKEVSKKVIISFGVIIIVGLLSLFFI